jgi:AcrR family transcriptional regulator
MSIFEIAHRMARTDSRTSPPPAQRLLEAALEVFARDGFRGATIERICKKAGANIAAAHYHYGDKRKLYAAVFEHAERRAQADRPAETEPTGPPEARPPSGRRRVPPPPARPGPAGLDGQLLAHELIDPTPALDRLVRRRMRANHEQIASIIRELAPGAPIEAVRLATLSIVAQCVFYRNSAAIVSRLYPDLDAAGEIDRLADHVTRFSLAGIATLRDRPEIRHDHPSRRWAASTAAARSPAPWASPSSCSSSALFRRHAEQQAPSGRVDRRRAGAHRRHRRHLDGIGTVTPRAMVTVRPASTGSSWRSTSRGPDGRARRPPRRDRPAPVPGAARAGRGQLARDQALLANAKVDVAALPRAREGRRDPEQQLDTQEALVRQYEAALVVDKARSTPRSLNLVVQPRDVTRRRPHRLRKVDAGNLVHCDRYDRLAVVTQLQPIDVVFTLPEDQLPALMTKVRAGDKLTSTRSTATGVRRSSRGARSSPSTTRSIRRPAPCAQGRIPEQDDALFPNQFVNARLELEVRRGVTIVPERERAARHAGHVRLGREGRPDRRDAAREARRDRGPGRVGRERRRRRRRRSSSRARSSSSRREGRRSRNGHRQQRPRIARRREPPVHRTAGRDHAAHGRDPSRRHPRLPAAAPSPRSRRSTTRRSRSCTFYRARAPT